MSRNFSSDSSLLEPFFLMILCKMMERFLQGNRVDKKINSKGTSSFKSKERIVLGSFS